MIKNIGLIYETLVTRCANCLIEGKDKNAASALKLSKRFFAVSKPLNAELKLHLSLAKPQNLTEFSANKLIFNVREHVVKTHLPINELDKCSVVLENVLHGQQIKLNEHDFKRHILIDKLFKAWRKNSVYDKVAMLETKLIQMLMHSNEQLIESNIELPAPSAILKRIMITKLAEQHTNLSDDQKIVLVEACANDNDKILNRAKVLSEKLELKSKTDNTLTENIVSKLQILSESLKTQEVNDILVAQILAAIDVEKEFNTI